MNTEPQADFQHLSLEEMIQLLIAKTSQLLENDSNKVPDEKFQALLTEVEQLHSLIKARRQNSSFK